MARSSAASKTSPSAAVTRGIAAFVAGLGFDALPRPVVEAAKDSFLDTLGIAVGGSGEGAGRVVASHVAATHAGGGASVIGRGIRVSAPGAALANGTMAHILGFSDFSVRNVLHPSVAVLPAVWALAEERDLPGRDAILAHVAGVEVACKIGAVLTPEFSHHGWHPCAIVGAFGAAAAAGKLLKLDAERMAHALGLAAIEASGIKVSLGSMAKAFALGRAAENGVVAALLAEAGCTGPTDALEGRDGFFQTFGGGVDGAGLVEQLGRPFEFQSPGITVKPYPSCTRSHPTLDAVLELKGKGGFAAADIESVECRVSPAVLKVVKVKNPRNALEAKFSMEFCVACALLDGALDVQTFVDAKLEQPAVKDLMRRVSVGVAADLAALGEMPAAAPFGGRVAVKLKDGRRLEAARDRGPWEPGEERKGGTRALLLPKFRSCAAPVLDAREIEVAAEFVERLETAPGIRPLMDVVRK